MTSSKALSVSDVREAHEQIKSSIYSTPVITCDAISQIASTDDVKINVFFKCENLQDSGSFKFRGASNFISQLSDSELRKGLVAISTGNFGFAVAKAACIAARQRLLDIPVSVVLPSTSARSKIAGAKANGAKVVLAGSAPEDRERAAKKILRETGATLVGPMDSTSIVLGQGTATLEFLDQVADAGHDLDGIVLPSATGGILAGASIVCQDAGCLVYGCEPTVGGPDLKRGIETGNLSRPQNQTTVADGLRASTARGNFERIRNYTDGFYTVEEHHIKQAWAILLVQLGPTVGLIEPSSAVALATLLFNDRFRANLRQMRSEINIGIVLTGGNTTKERIEQDLGDDIGHGFLDTPASGAVEFV